MALSNSQYNAVMRGYEERQRLQRHALDARIREVYEKVPQIRQLDQTISTTAADCARRVLCGDAGARVHLKEELEGLQQQKVALLREAGFSADYMELRYDCPDCRDTGYAGGKRCHCFERQRLNILYAQSNIESILKEENFEHFRYDFYNDTEVVPQLGMTELAYMKIVVRQCQEFADQYPQKGTSLLFTGGTGVGKTFLTNCIAKELIDRCISVIYLSSNELFEIFSKYKFGRDTDDEVEESYRYILECDMLIIDDLGTELNNSFVSSQLFYCINERINRKKGTIISTNLSMTLLRDNYSDRVTSRIMSNYRIIPLYGGDIRMKKRAMQARRG